MKNSGPSKELSYKKDAQKPSIFLLSIIYFLQDSPVSEDQFHNVNHVESKSNC